VLVLKTGMQWEDLPEEMGCGSATGSTLACGSGSSR
jgi:hypothetical protein